MTNEYIRKQDAVDAFNRAVKDVGILDADDIETVFGMLSFADVVQVVRCKDCKYRESDDFCVGRGFPYQLVAGDEFCSMAKTKEHIND